MAGSAFRPGTLLAGRFTLEDLLGEVDGAGFWRATDRVLARNVAVHVLSVGDPRTDALLTAARRSALVTDAHLLRVLDAATVDGIVYVVAEWGSGVSLDRMLAEGPLSPRRAAWVVKEVAEAIATAHRSQVAHGRLLPENVLISETGSVKLIGFAVDAVLRADSTDDPGPRRVTDGQRMTLEESDVLNLGALLYATLVGRWPGTEGSVVPAAPTEHGRPLRPRQVRAGVPRPLDAVCERVLGTSPQAVPLQTAHEVYAALSDFIGEPGAGAAATLSPLTGSLPPGAEPTALLARADAAGPDPDTATIREPAPAGLGSASDPEADTLGDAGADTGPDTDTDTDMAGDTAPAAAQAGPRLGSQPGDPEATQAGALVFSEEDSGGRWVAGDPDSPAPSLPPSAAAPPPTSAPSPPPPFTQPPERPLFADGPATTRPRGVLPDLDEPGAATGQRTIGAGNGPLPPRWGPDADQPADPGPGWADQDEPVPGRRWLWLAIALALVVAVVVAVVVVYNLGPAPQRQAAHQPARHSTSPSPTAPVAIAKVSDFDPQGDPPQENPDEAKLATDGNPATVWHTLTYRGNPKLGGLKDGVGLLVDLGKPRRVGSVRLTLGGSPTSVQILAAPGATSAPTSINGMRKVATKDGAGTKVDLPLSTPVTTRWFAVWLTSLPPVSGGFQGQVAEISVRS